MREVRSFSKSFTWGRGAHFLSHNVEFCVGWLFYDGRLLYDLGLSFGRVKDNDDCDLLKNRLLEVGETLSNCQKNENGEC